MLIKRIYLKNFKCFTDYHARFEDLNMVKGRNGVGKSALVKDSLMFTIYGHSDVPIGNLPTKGAKSCEVSVELEHLGDNYKITRKYPTSITIIKNDQPLEYINDQEKQKFLKSLFKDIEYFRKFRLLDVQQGINILEEGSTKLRKTLLSFNEALFSTIRQNLLDKKREREKYNKDAIVYKHYPSEKRLNILSKEMGNLSRRITELERDFREENSAYMEVRDKKARRESSKEYFGKQKQKIAEYSTCPVCEREMDGDTKNKLLEGFNKDIAELDAQIDSLVEDLGNQREVVEHFNSIRQKWQDRKMKINGLIMKLKAALQQKDYKWSERDVAIVKEAIGELDKFSGSYIADWLNNLEPIINSVIEKINFQVKFKLGDNGKLDIELTKDSKTYGYRELSTGQKLILTIAFQIALLLERNDTGAIIADEGFSSLDSENLESVIKLFQTLPFQLICIVHRYDNEPNEVNVINLGEDK